MILIYTEVASEKDINLTRPQDEPEKNMYMSLLEKNSHREQAACHGSESLFSRTGNI